MPVLAFLLMQSDAEIQRAQALVPAFITGCAIFALVFVVLIVIPFWFICKKAGLSPWLSLIVLFPAFGTLILLYIIAFVNWNVVPVQQLAYAPPYPPQQPHP